MNRHSTPFVVCLFLPLFACDGESVENSTADSSETPTSSSTGPMDPTDSTAPTEPESTGTPDPTTGPSTETTSADPTDGTTTDEPEPSTTDDPETTGVAACGEGVICEDDLILDLGLVSGLVSTGVVSNTADGDGWTSNVDATAGGIVDAPNNPWLYLRFTDSGLEQVMLDDLQALESEDWDIAAKRFGVRLNSGTSGPSCVMAGTLSDDYASVTTAPDGFSPSPEAFYDASCNLIDDGSGVGGANFALTPWWFYPGCVGVTYQAFGIELADGRHVKFMVESYYEEGQEGCNNGGTMGSGSANFVWRWAFLD